ncbi:cytochrome P450 [Lactarius quietus]|nr:cytochrome P450 [Lactarius quietus]
MVFDPFSIRFMISVVFPPSRLIPPTVPGRLPKSEILASADVDAKGGVEKKNIQGRDLLTLLIKANMATDILDSARMSDEDILSQVPTFLIAGHETTSTSVTWGLYALGCNPTVHAKLNAEARAFHTDTPSMDELNEMKYLDYFTREVLRLYAPVHKRTELPGKTPWFQWASLMSTDTGSSEMKSGDVINIPIRAIHRLKSLWGEDADEFRTLEAIPEAVKSLPGVFSNLLTFLAGAHACIGYRFSIIEMKALLFSFVRAFDFELAIPPSEITCRSMIVTRPFLASDPDKGPQLPLIIRPAKSD